MGVGFLIAHFVISNIFYKCLAVIVLICGVIISLQKMAIGYMALAFVLILYVSLRSLTAKGVLAFAFLSGVSFVVLLVAYTYMGGVLGSHVSYLKFVFAGDSSGIGDVTVFQSVYDRLVELPKLLYDHWGGLSLIIGVGVYGGAGGLGYPELPMAHNLFFEIVAIFGMLIGSLIIFCLLYFCCSALRNILISKSRNLIFVSSVFLTLVVTNMFSGGLFYQPVIGLVFWFSWSEMLREKEIV
ncbi:hypothetical protein D3C84_666020 [compost metagenome]